MEEICGSVFNLYMPPVELCGDNAAMIGLAAYYHIMRGDTASWREIKVDSNLKL
jgi:tRNA A37 threonylcarbamoyltransferase TsaD